MKFSHSCFLLAVLWKLASASKLHQGQWSHQQQAETEELEDSEHELQGEGLADAENLYEGVHDSRIEAMLESLSEEEQKTYHQYRAEALEEAQRLAAESRQRAMLSMEAKIQDAAGEDGILVVSSLKKHDPCDGVGYLHTTFIHVNHKEASFVCLPCSPLCKSACHGPGREGCDELKETDPKRRRPPVTLMKEATSRPFSHSFHEAFLQHSAELTRGHRAGNLTAGNLTGDATLPDSMLSCLETGECRVEEGNVTEAAGDFQFNETTAIISALTPDMSNDVDISEAHKDVQKAWDAAVARVGLIPGVHEDIDSNHSGTPEYDDEQDDAVIQSDAIGAAAGSFMQQDKLNAEFVESQEEACGMNRSKGLNTWQFNMIMQGKFKDLANWEAKMASRSFAKSTLIAWLGNQEGQCIDAIDGLIGVMQRLHKCYEQMTAVKNPICAAKNHYVNIRDSLQTIYTVSGGISNLANRFKPLPYIGGFATSVSNNMKTLHDSTRNPLQKVKDYKYSPHYGATLEDWDCCYPGFLMGQTIKDKCNPHPGKKHRCGGCDSGLMCNVYRTCNSFYVTELMIDDFGKLFMLPVIGAMALFAQSEGPLKACGFDSCSGVKKLSDTIVNKFEQSFLNKCPLSLSDFKFPEPKFLTDAQAVMNTINGFLDKLTGLIDKQHCVWVPHVHCETRWHCWHWCVGCPGWGRRRRWSGFHWRSCCGHTCVPYPHCWVSWHHYCFSAGSILNGINGWLNTFFSPLLAVVEKAIDIILTPVRWIMEGLTNSILKPLQNLKINIDFPDIGDLLPHIPGLDLLTCKELKQLAR